MINTIQVERCVSSMHNDREENIFVMHPVYMTENMMHDTSEMKCVSIVTVTTGASHNKRRH